MKYFKRLAMENSNSKAWHLCHEEVLRISQFVISSDLKFIKNVYAFTQEGVAMLSGVLRSARAVHLAAFFIRYALCPMRLRDDCAGLCAPSRDVDHQ